MKHDKWVPREPKHTCPNIDAWKRHLVERAEELEGIAAELRRMAEKDAEELRGCNTELREWATDIIDNASDIIDDRDRKIADLEENVHG